MIQDGARDVEERSQVLARGDDESVGSPERHVEGEIQAGEVAIGAGYSELCPIADESHRGGDAVTVFVDPDAGAGGVKRGDLEEDERSGRGRTHRDAGWITRAGERHLRSVDVVYAISTDRGRSGRERLTGRAMEIHFHLYHVRADATGRVAHSGRDREVLDVLREGLEDVPAHPGRHTGTWCIVGAERIEQIGQVGVPGDDGAVRRDEVLIDQHAEPGEIRVRLTQQRGVPDVE